MKRKMTLLALGAKGGALGARALAFDTTSAARAWRAKKPSRSSRPASATPVKPAPACQRNSRRVRPQNVLEGFRGFIAVPIGAPRLAPSPSYSGERVGGEGPSG